MLGFRFRSILYSERCAHICLAPSQNSNVWWPNIHVWTNFEPIFSLLVHDWIQTTVTQLAVVGGCRRKRQLSIFTIGCWLFIYWCTEDLNKQFSPSRNRFLRRTPTSLDRFALRQLLWPDYSAYKSSDSSTKGIPSLYVISLAVRDRQWNELPAKFKITWRHSNRPIRWRPQNNHSVWHRTKNRLKIIFMERGSCMGDSLS